MTLTRARGPRGLCLVCGVRHEVRVLWLHWVWWLHLVRRNKMKNLCVPALPPGSSNPEVPYPIIFRGAVFADSGRFDSCTTLWLHALRLRQDTGFLHWSGLFMGLKETVSRVFWDHFQHYVKSTYRAVHVSFRIYRFWKQPHKKLPYQGLFSMPRPETILSCSERTQNMSWDCPY